MVLLALKNSGVVPLDWYGWHGVGGGAWGTGAGGLLLPVVDLALPSVKSWSPIDGLWRPGWNWGCQAGCRAYTTGQGVSIGSKVVIPVESPAGDWQLSQYLMKEKRPLSFCYMPGTVLYKTFFPPKPHTNPVETIILC